MLLLAAAAFAQQPAPAAPASTGYTIFVRGTPLGREEVTTRSDAAGIVITSQGRSLPPINAQLRSLEIRYRSDWTPESFQMDATQNGVEVKLRATFKDGEAVIEGSQGATPITVTQKVSPQAMVIPNGVVAGLAGLARRLAAAPLPTELRWFAVPAAETTARVRSAVDDQMQIGTTVFAIRRYDLLVTNPGGDLSVSLTTSTEGQLVRVSIPAQGLDIVRDDLATSTARTQIYSNPGDEAVTIPVLGFNLGATLTRPRTTAGAQPAGAAPARLPAAVLLGGSGVTDRDGVAYGVPTLANMAAALADAGILAVRYDKRGFGQSGGRAEAATLSDYAEDARAVVKWLAARKDIDPKRIALIGHSEGAAVALLAASRDRGIGALVSIAGFASTGAELILEQQRYALDQMQLPEAERTAKIEQQKQIQTAVLSGKGWETVPPELRRQADTPWFQSLLAFDPAKTIENVRQPLLIVHGELDKQVPVTHADRLADLARKESKSKSVEVVIVRGVNHVLVPATTGDVKEYAALPDRTVSKDVTGAVTQWLTRTFQAIK